MKVLQSRFVLWALVGILSLVLLVSALASITTPPKDTVVGDNRDEYGCSTSLPFRYDADLELCVKAEDITDENNYRAVEIAQTELVETEDLARYALTVTAIQPLFCEGCYEVTFEQKGMRYLVTVENWEVTMIETL